MFLKSSSLALLICVAIASQYVPIQEFYDGIHTGNAGAKLHIETFYDLLCPDSKFSNGVLNQVFSQVFSTEVKFTIHMFPLPYHIQAHTTAIGVRFFEDKFGSAATFDYINYVFSIQDSISGAATFHKSQAQNLQEFAQNVTTHFEQAGQFNFTTSEFLSALQYRPYDLQARASWKYGCSRGIAGTPYFLVNGVILDGAETYQVSDWMTFIANALNGPKKVAE